MPKVPPAPSALHGQAQELKQIHKVLLLGPTFQKLDIPEEAWQLDAIKAWQQDIARLWPAVVLPGPEWDGAVKDALSKNGADKISKFDTATGQPNPEYEKLLNAAYAEAAKALGVQAILRTDFVPVAVQVDKKTNLAMWDGAMESAVMVTGARMIRGGRIKVRGELPAVSLFVQLVNMQGNVLYESRAGYSLIAKVKAGFFHKKTEQPDYQEVFDEGKMSGMGERSNPDKRKSCIALGLGPLMKAVAGAGQ